MCASKYGKCHVGSISTTPSSAMNNVETTLAITASTWVLGMPERGDGSGSLRAGRGQSGQLFRGQLERHAWPCGVVLLARPRTDQRYDGRVVLGEKPSEHDLPARCPNLSG